MTEFKKRVYNVVSRIPKGKVMSYKQVAEASGYPKAWRAVGNVLNKNRNPKVPCHRVIKSSGQVGGLTGGTDKKLALLRKEGVTKIK